MTDRPNAIIEKVVRTLRDIQTAKMNTTNVSCRKYAKTLQTLQRKQQR